MHPIKRAFAPFLLALSCFAQTAHSEGRPEIAQELTGFNRPVSAAFSPDGQHLFVVNHAQGETGTLRNQSFLSRLKVGESGVEMEQTRFVDSLTAPIDLDFSPVGFGNLPAGAIFLVVGTPLVQDDAGRALKDLSRVMVGVLIIDPRTGRVVKSIDLGPNSSIRLRGEESLLSPSSICFDKRGNLYIGEAGMGGHMFDRRQAGRPGIWRLEAATVAELVADAKPTKVEFIRTTSMPGDMCYRESDDMIYFVTNHTQGRPTGSVFRIGTQKYEGIEAMQTIARELPALAGIEITPKGRVLMAGVNGDLMFPKGKRNVRELRFRPKISFSTPGKIALLAQSDGSQLVAVPEQSSDAGVSKGQRLRVVKLSADY